MYIIKHKFLDLYMVNRWKQFSFDINQAKISSKRPLSFVRYWNREDESIVRQRIVESQGLSIDMRDFEVRRVRLEVI